MPFSPSTVSFQATYGPTATEAKYAGIGCGLCQCHCIVDEFIKVESTNIPPQMAFLLILVLI
ncbi:MAG: hypothetical protein BWX61_01411 [Bacteroidetes bacterium ADurb.Bin035]|nr:MAG: hypothetical protein BWX61_01411 [Bacteroidetes bacterium ADurb.Bin035]